MGFGGLRVLNDDVIQPGSGFGRHPHRAMEIISIPLRGALKHRDSAGHTKAIGINEVQVMSAGKGIYHSEWNASDAEEAHFLQIWINTRLPEAEPRYDQKAFDPAAASRDWQVLVSPDGRQGSLQIYADALIVRRKVQAGEATDYTPQIPGNWIYLFMIEGELELGGQKLYRRDGAGLSSDKIEFSTSQTTDLLLLEVAPE